MSVIIPARDASATFRETLETLLSQSFGSWEAIVVDDGSSDGTAAIAAEAALADERVEVLTTTGIGVSAARNLALERARAPWVLFLDADDLLAPTALEALHARACDEPPADAVYGRWRFLRPDGELAEPQPHPAGELFHALARTDPLAIHSCLVRREVVLDLGGFDGALATCEDWDLFQRLARSGARFAPIDELVAVYRLRGDSAMSATTRLMRDVATVIERGHGPDERVRRPDPRFAAGAPSGCAESVLTAAAWVAGLAIGREGDAGAVLECVRHVDGAPLSPALVAESLADAVPRGASRSPSAWPELWPAAETSIDAFLAELEAIAGQPGLARSARPPLERAVLNAARPARLTVIGRWAALDVDLSAPLADVRPPERVEKLIAGLLYDGERLGAVELPVCDRLVPAEVIADAAADALGWRILGRFLERPHYASEEDAERAHDERGWILMLRELWGEPGLESGDLYGADPASRTPLRLLAAIRGRTRGAAHGTLELSGELRRLPTPLALTVTIGGAPVGIVDLPAGPAATPRRQRAAVTKALGMELCRAAVREALIGRPREGAPLRERLAERARARTAGGGSAGGRRTLVLRRAPREFNSSAARRATLPTGALDELTAMASALGEPIVPAGAGRAPSGIDYLPDRLDGTIRRAPSPATRGSAGGAPRAPGEARSLPILMYHRIAASGSDALRRWRVTPAQFDEQLAYLQSERFTAISLEEWHDAAVRRSPVPGRPVCITFDDGLTDFAEVAWPLLKRYGMAAHVFVVTGEVGGWNRWDAAHGERLGLLDWEELAALRDDGVWIGSHTSSHARLGRLSPAEVTRELAGSRAALFERLGVEARALAYPHGDVDRTVEHLAGACGYRQAVTCEVRAAAFGDRPLALPRLEVSDRTTVGDLAALLVRS